MGIFKANAGDNIAAIELFSKAILLDTMYADAYNNRGSVYSTLKNYEKALIDFNKAIAIQSNDPLYYYNRAITKIKMGKPRLALTDYDKIIEISPADPEVYAKRAALKADLENYTEAVWDITKAITLNPKADYYYQSAIIKLQSNTFTDGHIDLIKATSLGQRQAKDLLLQSMLTNLPNEQLSGEYMRASYKMQEKQYDAAIKDLDIIVKRDPEQMRAYYLRGMCYIQLNKTTKACSDFTKAAPSINDASEAIKTFCNK